MTPQYLVSNRDVARFRVGTEDFFGVVALLAGETFAAAPVPLLTRATIDDFGQILAAFRTANLRGHRLRLFRHGREEGRRPIVARHVFDRFKRNPYPCPERVCQSQQRLERPARIIRRLEASNGRLLGVEARRQIHLSQSSHVPQGANGCRDVTLRHTGHIPTTKSRIVLKTVSEFCIKGQRP